MVTRYLRPLDELNASLLAHREWLQSLYDRGEILLSGRLDPPVGGAAVMRADDQVALEATLAEDPYHQLGYSETQIHALTPTDFPLRTVNFDRFLRGDEE